MPGKDLADEASSVPVRTRHDEWQGAHAGRTEVRMKSILDPSFRYTSSANTDIRKTFARVRREMRRQSQANPIQDGDNAVKVTPIFRSQRPAA
jgi:hypothetical protein